MLIKLISKARALFTALIVDSEDNLWPNRTALQRLEDDRRLN